MRGMARTPPDLRSHKLLVSRTNLWSLLFRGYVTAVESAEPSAPVTTAAHADRATTEWLEKFERRTYVTFLSRARASTRVATRGVLWMIALSVASAASLCVSVVSLSGAERPVSEADLASALFALATLVLSLIVASLDFQGRSRDLFHSFRAIQRVSARAESLRELPQRPQTVEDVRSGLESAYQDALDQSENHTTLDYYLARPPRAGEHKKTDDRTRRLAFWAQGALTAFPVLVILASVLWLMSILWTS